MCYSYVCVPIHQTESGSRSRQSTEYGTSVGYEMTRYVRLLCHDTQRLRMHMCDRLIDYFLVVMDSRHSGL